MFLSFAQVYVQHKMAAVGEQLSNALLNDDACLYVCGDGAKMAQDVHSTVLSILIKHGGLDSTEADQFLQDLVSSRRYLKDVWL